jgi:phenylacetate-CoA ligase
VRAAKDIGTTAYAGTPDYLKVILDAAEEGRHAEDHAGGGGGRCAVPEPARRIRGSRHPCLQCYATADLGNIAYESEAMEGMIVDEGVIVEIVRPGTGDPVAEGEVGEVVVTTLNPDYPLIRFATGDLSAVLPGREPLRADQHAHQGLDGPCRPDHQDQGHVRAARAGGGVRGAP